MSESTSILVIQAVVNKESMAEVPLYLESVMKVFGQHGGVPVARFKLSEILLGDEAPEMIAALEFPDAETIRNMVKGPEFNALSELRSRVFAKLIMVICERM